MALGPGNYDDLATYCREKTDATTVVVLVLDGIKGNGFSVQSIDPSFASALPNLLEAMAKQIREDAKTMEH
jgi:hypothetical protein